MKKLILTFICTLYFINITNAQIGYNLQEIMNWHLPSLDKFVGTWLWHNNSDTFKLILKKGNKMIYSGMNIRSDVIYGFHEYKQGNTVIESSLQFANSTIEQEKNTIQVGHNKNTSKENEVFGHIKNISINNKGCRFELSIFSSSSLASYDKLTILALRNYPGLRVTLPGQQPFNPAITLPTNVTFTRQ